MAKYCPKHGKIPTKTLCTKYILEKPSTMYERVLFIPRRPTPRASSNGPEASNSDIFRIHSVSLNRDTLIGTRLVSLEKIEDSSLFGGKCKTQNSLFLAYLWVFMEWNHRILPRYLSVTFLDKNKGQVLV